MAGRRRRRGRRKKENEQFFIKSDFVDYALLFLVLFLVAFGLVMIYSTSSYTAELRTGSAIYYLKRQGICAVLGIIIMVIVSKIDYHFWMRFARPIVIIMIGLLAIVLFFGTSSNGSVRWLQLGPIRFQPSEAAKIAVILYTARMSSKLSNRIGELPVVARIFLGPVAVVGLIASQNLSTAIICIAIAAVVIFVTSPKVLQFFAIGGVLVLFMVLFLCIKAYRLERLKVWLHPEDFEDGYQTMQALYAIGSGGVFGKGLGQSIQKLGFIPESHNDYIFSVICEELGLFGAICIIAIFVLLIWRCVVIAMNAPDLFGALIVVGVVTHIAVQVIINVAVVTNAFPSTGVPLPFISYGGTAIVCLLAEMGFVLSVSRQIRVAKEY